MTCCFEEQAKGHSGDTHNRTVLLYVLVFFVNAAMGTKTVLSRNRSRAHVRLYKTKIEGAVAGAQIELLE